MKVEVQSRWVGSRLTVRGSTAHQHDQPSSGVHPSLVLRIYRHFHNVLTIGYHFMSAVHVPPEIGQLVNLQKLLISIANPLMQIYTDSQRLS